MANFFNFFVTISDMRNMEPGLTIREIAAHLGIKPKTAAKRLDAAGRTPREYVGRTAIYEQQDEDAIRNVNMGRPPKARPEDQATKPAKK
jgi:Mn-dependent DtxR family transcriptional regulator